MCQCGWVVLVMTDAGGGSGPMKVGGSQHPMGGDGDND